MNRLEKFVATTGAEPELADVSEPETTFEAVGISELETTSEPVDTSETETTFEAENEPAPISEPEDSDQAMGMDPVGLSTVSTATTEDPAPVVDQQGDNASLVSDSEPGSTPLTTPVEEAPNTTTPAIVATAEQSEQDQDQWVY